MATVRIAKPADLAVLLNFEQAIVSAERPFDVTLRGAGVHYYDISRLMVDDQVRFLVAQSGGEIVACGFARIDESKPYLTHHRHAYLGLMYTREGHRGRGINSLIIEALKEWCISRGIYEMRLDVYAGNAPAVRAYEKAGFEKNLVEMRMALK